MSYFPSRDGGGAGRSEQTMFIFNHFSGFTSDDYLITNNDKDLFSVWEIGHRIYKCRDILCCCLDCFTNKWAPIA